MKPTLKQNAHFALIALFAAFLFVFIWFLLSCPVGGLASVQWDELKMLVNAGFATFGYVVIMFTFSNKEVK